MPLGELAAVRTRSWSKVSDKGLGWMIRTEASPGTDFKRENLKALSSKLPCKTGLNFDIFGEYSWQWRVQSVQTSWPYQPNTPPFSINPTHRSTKLMHCDSRAPNLGEQLRNNSMLLLSLWWRRQGRGCSWTRFYWGSGKWGGQKRKKGWWVSKRWWGKGGEWEEGWWRGEVSNIDQRTIWTWKEVW